ncbi:Pre-mRNA-splicing factor dre4 [Ceratocystis lukuohia]|uniref:Pre-mRNA-splicing factor dre4 n=1 Tax=Ceratocystis lukuohia TaxID=2019550 RepID=A0ABR4MR76_9PEZI
MLKSTYKPSVAGAAASAPLLPGWTEHKAPSGQIYYYHAETKQSTYKRPSIQPMPTGVPVLPSLPTPAAANAFMAQVNPQHFQKPKREAPKNDRPKPQPIDKPRSQVVIPGHDGWYLVYTKYKRRFVYNTVKGASYWRIPDKLKDAILELDKAKIRAEAGLDPSPNTNPQGKTGAGAPNLASQTQTVESDSEYEEIEVTDDENENEDDEEDEDRDTKRQRTEELLDNGPVEFTEEDILLQLQAMGEGGFDSEQHVDDEWAGEGQETLSEEDSKALFWDMLDDFKINPFSPWEKLIDDGKVIDDPRYSILHTTKARKECWDAWTREKIRIQKERRATEEKQDPKLAYISFLAEHASVKLFWPEFKRKYRKESCMGDRNLSDKDREKLYRELISRLKMSQNQRKSDLLALLKAQPVTVLNSLTDPSDLPLQLRSHMHFISVEPSIRDPLVEALIQSLPPPPEGLSKTEDLQIDEATAKAQEARRKREKALKDSEERAEFERRKQRRELEYSKQVLKQEQIEIEAAMQVGKHGLHSQLAKDRQ